MRLALLRRLLTARSAALVPASPQTAPANRAKPAARMAPSGPRHGRRPPTSARSRRRLAAMKQGGSAVDAAIAAHAVLGLVEPQSSGLGGGGYMVVYDRKSNTTTVFDGRETAPATATADYFTVNGQNLGFGPAIQSGKSVGAPGAVALYKAAHEQVRQAALGQELRSRRSSWRTKASSSRPRLANSLGARFQNGPLGKNPGSGEYFFPNGKPLAVGDRRTNPEYASDAARRRQGRTVGLLFRQDRAGHRQRRPRRRDPGRPLAEGSRRLQGAGRSPPCADRTATTRSARPRPRLPAASR